jgi:predicted nucleic acid-binding protein
LCWTPGIAGLDHLGDGEKAVLSLGLLHPKGLLVLDDLVARQTAELNSLNLIGTLGILLAAKKQGHLNEIGPVLHDLTRHGFHLKLDLHNSILRRAGEPEI